MKATFLSPLVFGAGLLAVTAVAVGQPHLMGTSFSYQGQLLQAGSPVNGTCDFQFSLWQDGASVNPADQIGSRLTFDGAGGNPAPIDVYDGLFGVKLDFGSGAIDGMGRWLEMAVCCPSPCSVVTQSPRTELTPTPHALALPGLRTQQNANSPNLIGGYAGNSVSANVVGATIAGGGAEDNGYFEPWPNRVTDDYGTVGGGVNNMAGNDDIGSMLFATVSGGSGNVANNTHSTVAGGQSNVAYGVNATVGGGSSNTAAGAISTVAGGHGNRAGAYMSTVGGGGNNSADSYISTVAGGENNVAGGIYSTVPGGDRNSAGGDHSFAAGRRAKADHNGAFVWADSADADFISSGDNQFLIRASGGVGIGTNDPAEQLDVAGNIHASGAIASGNSLIFDGPNDRILAANAGGEMYLGRDPAFGSFGDLKLGVGTMTPSAMLDVEEGSVLFAGTTGGTPVSGAGTRLMWVPGKKAFRAGYVEDDKWDDANIGEASVAMGGKTIASGFCSISLGFNNYATGGFVSTAIGQGNTASASYSTAIGFGSQANGWASGARGNYMRVDGPGSYGIGLGNNPSGWTVAGSSTMAIMGGNVGIGTTSPGEKLEVAGIVHSTTGGVKFPDGTIQTTAVAAGGGNHAGIASQNDTPGLSLSSSMNDILTVTITVPAAGHVVVEGSCELELCCTASANYAYVQIDTTAGGGQTNPYYRRAGAGAYFNSASHSFPAYVTRVFPVGAGSHTYRLEGMHTNSGIADALNPILTATYYPITYGPTFPATASEPNELAQRGAPLEGPAFRGDGAFNELSARVEDLQQQNAELQARLVALEMLIKPADTGQKGGAR